MKHDYKIDWLFPIKENLIFPLTELKSNLYTALYLLGVSGLIIQLLDDEYKILHTYEYTSLRNTKIWIRKIIKTDNRIYSVKLLKE
jgi:hypothetical protein